MASTPKLLSLLQRTQTPTPTPHHQVCAHMFGAWPPKLVLLLQHRPPVFIAAAHESCTVQDLVRLLPLQDPRVAQKVRGKGWPKPHVASPTWALKPSYEVLASAPMNSGSCEVVGVVMHLRIALRCSSALACACENVYMCACRCAHISSFINGFR